MKRLWLFLLLLVAPATFAQTSVTGRWGVGAFATRPAACGSGDTWTDTDDANSYKCFPNGTWNTISGGGGGSPGGGNGDVQLNIGGSFGIVSGFNYNSSRNILFMPFNVAFKGASPWADIINYGARNASIHTTGTGSGTSLTVVANNFVNGDGITILGGGAASTLSTPGSPTVTPGESVLEINPSYGITSGMGCAGVSTYNYTVFAEGIGGDLSIPATPTTINNGASALGVQTDTLNSLSITGNTISIGSASSTCLSQYALVHITSTSTNSALFSGWFDIHTINSATTATIANTYQYSATTQTAASATLTYWVGNNVSWTAVPNAFRYWVCVERPGDVSYKIIGTALPGQTAFIDYGFNLTQTIPWYVTNAQCTAGVTQPKLDIDTVASGGGTTSLTLTNGLTTAVTAAATRLDNATAIGLAATAAQSLSAMYVPPGSFEINSNITLPQSIGIIQAGNLIANDTISVGFATNWSGLSYKGAAGAVQFAEGGFPPITCNANPCIQAPNPGSMNMSYLNINGADNGVLVVGPTNNSWGYDFNHVNFVTGTDDNDKEGIAFYGPPGVAKVSFSHVMFFGGPNQTVDETWAPLVFGVGDVTHGGATFNMEDVQWNRRGLMMFQAGGGAAHLNVHKSYRQGGITPQYAISNSSGAVGGDILINDSHQDSEQQATLAMWGIAGAGLAPSWHLGMNIGPQADAGGVPGSVTASDYTGAECIGSEQMDGGTNCGTDWTYNNTTGSLQPTFQVNMNGLLFTGTTISATTSFLNSGFFDVTETAAPANPAAGKERWYANSTTHNLSCLTSAGGNCSPGGSAPTLQTNSVNNSTQNLLNIINSTTNATGLALTQTNTSGGIVQGEISGTVNLASGGCAGSSALTCFNNISLMTSLGDLLYGGAGGSETRLQGPGVGTNLPYVLEDIPSGGSATAPQWGILGVPVPATQTGAFTFSGAGSAGTLAAADQLSDILANPSAPSTYTIPATSALNFNNNPAWSVFNENATNTVTFSSSSTIIGDTVALPLWQTKITQQAGSSSYIIRSYPSMAAWGSTCTTKAIQWSTTSGILCNQLSLTTGVTGTLPIANGGTNGTTQQAALNNIAPSAIRAGDIMYYNGTNWTNLGGNNSGTQFLQENASGVPSWNSGTTTTPLSSVTAATGSATIANANFPITWNWAQTTAAQYGFTLGETAAKTGAGGGSLLVQTQAGSTGIPVTVIDSLTGSQTLPALTVTPTWNTTGVVDAGILENVTNTASGTASLLMDLQVGGTSEFKVDKAGNETITGTLNSLTIPASAGSATIAQKIASGTAALGTSAIGSGACATVVTVSATGTATTDVIIYTPNTDPTVVTGYAPSTSGSVYIWAYPTSNNVNFKVCNNSVASITPSALTLNWKVMR